MIKLDELWNDAKGELAIKIQAVSFDIWIDKLVPVCFIKNTLVLSTISVSSKREIDKKYLDIIKETHINGVV